MAVAIRLKREGRKNRPFYRIIVADKRSPRDGKFIEILGFYDPVDSKTGTKIDMERADYWLGVGAQPSLTVASIIKREKKQSAAAASKN